MQNRTRDFLRGQKIVSRLLVTLAVVVLYRVGATIPLPGVDYEQLGQVSDAAANSGALGVLNLFSGGALSQAAIFSLGVLPYVTSSIVMQLLESIIPALKDLRKQGEVGRRKINSITRALALVVAAIEGVGVVALLVSGDQSGLGVSLVPEYTWWKGALLFSTVFAGFLLLVWLSELVTRKGLGSGMSVLILASMSAVLPAQIQALHQQVGWSGSLTTLAVVLVCIALVVAFSLAERHLALTQAKGATRRRSSSRSHLPLKVVHAGIVPVIFTSGVLALVGGGAQLLPQNGVAGSVRSSIIDTLGNSSSWVFATVFAALVLFFAYFYTALTFSPLEVADDMRKHGTFLPGIRPGEETIDRLAWVVGRLAIAGGIILAVVASVPNLGSILFGVTQIPLGGASVLIATGVVLDTVKQVRVRALLSDYDRLVDGTRVDRELEKV